MGVADRSSGPRRSTPETLPRSARQLQMLGQEPDPRFTFANERTFLAWNRTALALVAAGLFATQLLDLKDPVERMAIALPPIVLGIALSATSYHRWLRNQTALRLGQPLAPTPLLWLLAGGSVAIAVTGAFVAIAEAL